MLSFEVRQFKILKHHLDKLVQTHLGFIIVDACLISRLVPLLTLFALADGLAGLNFPIASLADARDVFAVHEAVFLDAANGHFDDPIIVLADDRFLGNDVGDVVADRLADFLTVAQAVAGAAITTLPG